jgi:hypothetical protein
MNFRPPILKLKALSHIFFALALLSVLYPFIRPTKEAQQHATEKIPENAHKLFIFLFMVGFLLKQEQYI